MKRLALVAVVGLGAVACGRNLPLQPAPPAPHATTPAPTPDMSCGPLNACGQCGPTPPEVCNGVDDNCNGVIDEGCVIRLDDLGDIAAVRTNGARTILATQTSDYYSFFNAGNYGGDILVRDSDGSTTTISAHGDLAAGVADPTWDGWPAVDGDLVAWLLLAYEDVGYSLRIHNLATHVTTEINRSNVLIAPPTVNAGRVAWAEDVGEYLDGARSLWLLDTTGTRPRQQVMTPPGRPWNPSLWGDWIVYELFPLDVTSGVGPDIYSQNLVTGELHLLSDGTGKSSHPRIDGGRVVWGRTDAAYDADVVTRDLTGDSPAVVVGHHVNGNWAGWPVIRGSLVCWQQPGETWAVDLDVGHAMMVGVARQVFGGCDIGGRRIVWDSSWQAMARDLLDGEP